VSSSRRLRSQYVSLGSAPSPTSPSPPLLPPRSGPPRALLSFPTRRSSDLGGRPGPVGHVAVAVQVDPHASFIPRMSMPRTFAPRSEEHTSELQSREKHVCRLLLEKKKPLCRSVW